MSGFNTSNTESLHRRDVYSQIVLDILDDQSFLPEGMARDVSDFPDGSVLRIPTFGDVVIKDLVEDQDTPLNTVDTGEITLEITQHQGGGTYITDEKREDAFYMAQLDATLPMKYMRAMKESYESDLLATGPENQVAGDPNLINNYAHRWVASGPGQQLTLLDFAYAKTALMKANVGDMPVICVVDPITELTFNSLTNLTNVSFNPAFQGMVETGFAKNMRFIRNIYGIDVYVSNRLPISAAGETIDTTAGVPVPGQAGPVVAAPGSYFVEFFVMGDEMVTPLMSAWRRKPDIEFERQGSKRRDAYYFSARWGFGMQRPQSFISVLTSSVNS